MRPQNTILYIAEVDFPEADLQPFIEWYAYRHVADLFKAGFRSCASYRAVEGGMNVLDIYDMDGVDVFASSAYLNMEANDPYDTAVMRNARGEAATIYSQQSLFSRKTDGAIPFLDADWLSVIRFETAENTEGEIVSWLADEYTPLLSKHGATGVRFATRSASHPKVRTYRPRCLALAEWPERPPTEIWNAKILTSKFGNAVSDLDVYVGLRLYPWPRNRAKST